MEAKRAPELSRTVSFRQYRYLNAYSFCAGYEDDCQERKTFDQFSTAMCTWTFFIQGLTVNLDELIRNYCTWGLMVSGYESSGTWNLLRNCSRQVVKPSNKSSQNQLSLGLNTLTPKWHWLILDVEHAQDHTFSLWTQSPNSWNSEWNRNHYLQQVDANLARVFRPEKYLNDKIKATNDWWNCIL